MNNLLFNNRFIFQEAPSKAPQNPAKERMDDVMPPMQAEVINEPIGAEELKRTTKGYSEISIEGKQDVIDAAKKGIKETAKKADNLHKSSYTVVGADGYEYVYVYDMTNTPNDRLFRSAETVVEDIAKEYADATLKYGYIEAGGAQAKKIAKAVAKILKGDPPAIIVDKIALVDNRILTKDEASKIKGNVAYAIRIKGTTRVFFGSEA